MQFSRNIIGILAATILSSSHFSPAAGQARRIAETVDRTFSVMPAPQLVLRNVDGKTRVVVGSDGQVIVRAIKEVYRASSDQEARDVADRIQIRMEQAGNRIEVEAVRPSSVFSFWRGPSVNVHFEVTVPRRSDLDVHSVDGPVHAEGVEGTLNLRTVDGSLTVSGCRGKLNLRSTDGAIRLQEGYGDLEARAVDGSIEADGTWQALKVRSTDGRIHVRAGEGSAVLDPWSVETTDGSITIALPAGLSAELDLRTGDGRIRSDHPLSLDSSPSKTHLKGKLNAGGNRITVRTHDGNIAITKS